MGLAVDITILRQSLQLVSSEKVYELLSTVKGFINGNTAIHFAAYRGHPEVITLMLQSVTPDQQIQLLDIKGYKNQTAAEKALANNHQSTADLIQQYRLTAVNIREPTPGMIYHYAMI
jgi:hypothetical protein